ncbi:hypothetical protein HB364_25760 [Pseudoflavitalea sp. X16]|uniref:ankyrin repeat domain-containing protein n=1 Tax=Paraflavitalea devenefica TaxID=2716334 RepID=UPI00141EA73C|nr:ankyrin repeat domain-containing protein [Paraflavitalea devenefica]NII28516.1 hypothetical protein [Paraflavitalea devenefica]
MNMQPLPLQASLDQYQQQADDLYEACIARDKKALRFIKDNYFWRLTDEEFRNKVITKTDAVAAITNLYAFNSWQDLADWVAAITQPGSLAARFEAAVEAIVAGDIPALQTLLQDDPSLISARSMRSHHSMLLHYTGTNGVENYRQRYPSNAVEVLQFLLAAGADVNATAGMYGGGSTTLGLMATSFHPAKAGIMTTMLQILLDAGAYIDDPGASGHGHCTINGCLANGRPEAADYLMRKGARLDLEAAIGVGRLDVVQQYFREDGTLLPTATQTQLERGLMWAGEYGHTAVIEFLANQGLDLNTNVDGMYSLHWALIGGHPDTIQLLLARGASTEVRNMYGGNAIGCAVWAVGNSDGVYRWPQKEVDYMVIIETLLKAGASIERGMLGWLAQESDLPSPTIERLDALFRQYGATS